MLDGRAYTVLTLRPGTAERFATNRYHGTWHILSDVGGGQLLGRLMWAMAFQRHADTILLLDDAVLVENPFDADPPSPIVIVNTALGELRQGAVGALQAQLPLRGSSDGTVVLQTPGLDLAHADTRRTNEGVWWRAQADRRRIFIAAGERWSWRRRRPCCGAGVSSSRPWASRVTEGWTTPSWIGPARRARSRSSTTSTVVWSGLERRGAASFPGAPTRSLRTTSARPSGN